MATHNRVRLIGYLTKDPSIFNQGDVGGEKFMCILRTVRRDLDGYPGSRFEDVFIYSDEDKMMPMLAKLRQFDIIDMTGVVNIVPIGKYAPCTVCGHNNLKDSSTSTFVYPLSCRKIGNYAVEYAKDKWGPDTLLTEQYGEDSNYVDLIGQLVRDPEEFRLNGLYSVRYPIAIHRKYFIKTQSDVKWDYPWVYTFGKQAEMDKLRLRQGGEIFLSGFIHAERVNVAYNCEYCHSKYMAPDVRMEFIPYSVEYLGEYITDEQMARDEMAKMRLQAAGITV